MAAGAMGEDPSHHFWGGDSHRDTPLPTDTLDFGAARALACDGKDVGGGWYEGEKGGEGGLGGSMRARVKTITQLTGANFSKVSCHVSVYDEVSTEATVENSEDF